MTDLDLRGALNLESVTHRGPSGIGIDTLYKSQGQIPEVFLYGCGIPKGLMEYRHDLVKAEQLEGMFFSCFISYSHRDEAFAKQTHEFLQKNNVRVWYAPANLRIGDKIRETLHTKICMFDKLFLILSKHSINSDWVEEEVEYAFNQERVRKSVVLFPIRLDDSVFKCSKGWLEKLTGRHIGDFTSPNKYEASFARLLGDLRTLKRPVE